MKYEGESLTRLLLSLKSVSDQIAENLLSSDSRIFSRYFTSGAAGRPGIIVFRSQENEREDFFDVYFTGGFLSGPSEEILDLLESYAFSLREICNELKKWMTTK